MTCHCQKNADRLAKLSLRELFGFNQFSVNKKIYEALDGYQKNLFAYLRFLMRIFEASDFFSFTKEK